MAVVIPPLVTFLQDLGVSKANGMLYSRQPLNAYVTGEISVSDRDSRYYLNEYSHREIRSALLQLASGKDPVREMDFSYKGVDRNGNHADASLAVKDDAAQSIELRKRHNQLEMAIRQWRDASMMLSLHLIADPMTPVSFFSVERSEEGFRDTLITMAEGLFGGGYKYRIKGDLNRGMEVHGVNGAYLSVVPRRHWAGGYLRANGLRAAHVSKPPVESPELASGADFLNYVYDWTIQRPTNLAKAARVQSILDYVSQQSWVLDSERDWARF